MDAFINKIIKSYGQKELRIHSSSAAFYIVVSALPLMAILIFTLSFLSPPLLEELDAFLKSILPQEFWSGLSSIISGITKNRLPVLVPFTVLAALWGSGKGVGGLCYAVERIYGIQKQPHIILRYLKTAWRTLLFYLVIIASLFIFALGRLIPRSSLLIEVIINLRVIIFGVILSVVFSLFYSRLAGTHFKNHLFGGILAAIGWMLFTFFYSLYVSYAISSASIYAELGAAIFFMLWVYFCVNIILIGAEINKTLMSHHNEKHA